MESKGKLKRNITMPNYHNKGFLSKEISWQFPTKGDLWQYRASFQGQGQGQDQE